SADAGRFDLAVDGTVRVSNVGDGGDTGVISVATGSSHSVSEAAHSGTSLADYTSTWSCSTNGGTATTGSGASVTGLTVAKGDAVVCTFTNTRKSSITIVKDAIGTKDDTFSFTGSGTGVDSSFTITTSNGTNQKVFPGLAADTYTVTEGDLPPGWAFTSLSCSDQSDASGASTIDGQGATVSLQAGENVTCTFTNTEKGTIVITKDTLGGNGSFDFTSNLPDPADGGDFTLDTGTSNTASQEFSVSPDDYTVAEPVPDGWTLTGLSCDQATEGNPNGGRVDDENSAQADIHVEAGGVVHCTFTDGAQPSLVVVKNVDNSNGGGSKLPGDFTMHVSGPNDYSQSGPGSNLGTAYTLPSSGTYSVTEDAVTGYSLTSTACGESTTNSVLIDWGQTVTCTLTNTSAAPPPPSRPPSTPTPVIDLAITKIGSPNPAMTGSNITWTMVVTNNGPSTATGINLGDPLPAGTTFVSVAATQGTCAGGAVISCQLGALASGASVTITLVTTATTAGTDTNTATVVGNESESNTANNTASALVAVNTPPGVFKPPKVKPRVYCAALMVSPKSLFTGRHALLTMKVTKHAKAVAGIKVRITGAGLLIVTHATNKKGVVKRGVFPKKAGIVTFGPVAQKSCRSARIGVIGVFTPPVTG
ncbi:MAG TPA: hypothetical protein VG369_06290, partial [Humibacter sp.]|nr:hypothetical protein [Humibacter sp.]